MCRGKCSVSGIAATARARSATYVSAIAQRTRGVRTGAAARGRHATAPTSATKCRGGRSRGNPRGPARNQARNAGETAAANAPSGTITVRGGPSPAASTQAVRPCGARRTGACATRQVTPHLRTRCGPPARCRPACTRAPAQPRRARAGQARGAGSPGAATSARTCSSTRAARTTRHGSGVSLVSNEEPERSTDKRPSLSACMVLQQHAETRTDLRRCHACCA